jgi:hypothetical protein
MTRKPMASPWVMVTHVLQSPERAIQQQPQMSCALSGLTLVDGKRQFFHTKPQRQ